MALLQNQSAWTPEEDALFRELYGTMTIKEMVPFFAGRSARSLGHRVKSLGIANSQRLKWTEAEDLLLRQHYGTVKNAALLALFPGRSARSIAGHAWELGLCEPASESWSATEDAKLIELYRTVAATELCALFPGRTKEAVQGRASVLGIAKEAGKPWTEAEYRILRVYYPQTSAREISKRLLPGRSAATIHQRAYKLGIAVMDGIPGRKTFGCNETFFTEPNLLNSYWAGFIAADGYIDLRGGLTIGLQERDSHHLQRFVDDCDFTGSVKLRILSPSKQTGKVHRASYLFISSTTWASDLKRNFNIVTKKSLVLKPPEGLSLDCMRAFMVGYIDGDGCLCLKNDRGTRRLTIEVLGTEAMLDWIKLEFDSIAPDRKRGTVTAKVRSRYKDGRICAYSIGGHRAVAVAETLLQLDLPRLWRKWDKVKAFQSLLKPELETRQSLPLL